MKRKLLVMLLSAIALCGVARAQATGEDWVGIWHADVGGQPSSMLTLASDTGELGGTLVLDMVSGEGGQPHVIASEPHVLMNLRVVQNELTFQVKMRPRDGANWIASFTVRQSAAGKATIHCVNCGADAPSVELVKGP
jgi:hypothetical protein